MEHAIQRLHQLDIAKQGYLKLHELSATAGANSYVKSVRGSFSAHFNINSFFTGRNNNGIRLVACRIFPTGRVVDDREELGVDRYTKLPDARIYELPPVEVSFSIWLSNQTEHRQSTKNLNQLEITACNAPWLPTEPRLSISRSDHHIEARYDDQENLTNKLNKFLKEQRALDDTDLNAKFEALLDYFMHRVMRDLFSVGISDDDNNKLQLTFVLMFGHEQFRVQKVLDQLMRTNNVPGDGSGRLLPLNERNILFGHPWRTWWTLTKYDEQCRRNLPAPAVEQQSNGKQPVAGSGNKPALTATAASPVINASTAPKRAAVILPVVSPKKPDSPVAHRTRARGSLAAQIRTCPICFDDKHSTAFFDLTKCRHTFCCECLQQHITVKIDEGCAKSAKCPDLKCQQLIEYDDVKKLIPRSTFEKFDKLLLELEIGAMDDVEVCSNNACNMQYVIDAVSLTRAGHTTAQCPHCHDVLCLLCRESLRGNAPHTCELKGERIQQVLDEYERVTTSASARLKLEQMYGKQKLKNLCDNRWSEREVESKKKCPQCKAPCIKDEGCNKVTCSKCTTVWCWLCNSKIPTEGYAHFNVAGGSGQSKCTGKLFEGVPGRDRAGAAAAPPPVNVVLPPVNAFLDYGHDWMERPAVARDRLEERFRRLVDLGPVRFVEHDDYESD